MDNDLFDIIQYPTKCGKHTHQQFPFAAAYNTETVQLAFSDCFGFPITFESSVDNPVPQDSVRSFPIHRSSPSHHPFSWDVPIKTIQQLGTPIYENLHITNIQ